MTNDHILGAFLFHILSLIVIGGNLIILYGTYCYPFSFGLLFTIPYFTYTYYTRYELKDGYRLPHFSKHFFIFRILRRYLQMSVVCYNDDDTNGEDSTLIGNKSNTRKSSSSSFSSNYMYAAFPHGCNADYRMLMDGIMDQIVVNPNERDVKTLAASILFRIPIVRELALYTGCIDASKRVVEYHLRKKDCSILLLPGGEAEQIRTIYQKERIFVKVRKGFIKLALQYNVPVVPIYVFGVNDYYKTSSFGMNIRLWFVKNLGICIPLCHGISPLCPYPVQTTIVVGSPIQHPHKNNNSTDNHHPPTQEMIDQYHEQFCQELIHLFDHHKHQLGYGNRTIVIM